MAILDSVKAQAKRGYKKWTTKEGFLGDYNYAYLFTPSLPFIKQKPRVQPFFGLNSDLPLLLGAILGFQHALAMLAGVVTPPIVISASANLDAGTQQFLVSSTLITSGILTFLQITRFKIFRTRYYFGTGLLSVLGPSFSTLTVASQAFVMMYDNGTCKIVDGVKQPCPEGYGMILGSVMVCAFMQIAMSFIPPKILKKMFPAIVTGPVVLAVSLSLIGSGFKDWLGGSNCMNGVCPSNNGTTAEWGSARYVGLGFLVFLTILLVERYGAPVMRSCSVICGLLVGCIVGAGCGYFTSEKIDEAPAATFLWVHTFKFGIYAPSILPLLAIFIIFTMETIAEITNTADASNEPIEGDVFESRVQGGILADGVNCILSALGGTLPVANFGQNNGVISVTKCGNINAGYWCCFFLVIMGIFSKFAAAVISIPKGILGGMTTFLYTSVAASGLRIISTLEFNRRDRFILTASLAPGFGAVLVSGWFTNVFTYEGGNNSLKSFYNAITLLMNTGFCLTGIFSVILNLALPVEEDEFGEVFEINLLPVSHTPQSSSAEPVTKEHVKVEVKDD